MLTVSRIRCNGSAVFQSEFKWPYGVTVSTLDSESSDGGSNPPTASFCFCVACGWVRGRIARATRSPVAAGPCGVMDNALDF